VRVFLLGEQPKWILAVFAPTFLAILLDVVIRPRSLAGLPAYDVMNYTGSSLAGMGFTGGLLWLVSRLSIARRGRVLARSLYALFFVGVFLPFAVFAYAGQALYYAVFHAYISHDTVRLGIRLRGTVLDWLSSWGANVGAMVVVAVVLTAAIALLMKRAAPALATASPVVPILGLAGASYCLWIDFVETRVFQAAPPDVCFLNGVAHALKVRVTGKGAVTRGVTLRSPEPLPPLTPAQHRPNVLVILSESLRADAWCSDAETCRMRFLDDVAKDRVGLGELTAQSSGTFTSCMVLWTGLAPDADFKTAHRAPTLWEVAHAVGYRTAYIAAQNLRYEDMAVYVERAGIDLKLGAFDLGPVIEQQIGGPDELATERTLQFIREVPPSDPYFGILHLCNTHMPYRVDPALQPFEPHDAKPWGDTEKLHNHYRNSVLLQERTVTDFLRKLRAMPRWDDTVVLFLSDHAEQFREHGRLYHLNHIFDDEVRVPGFLLAGPLAVTADQRAAVATFAGERTYTQDVHATVLDLLGVFDARESLPLADRVAGRSLLRPRPPSEPIALMSTQSGVWEDDDPRFGARRGPWLVVGTDRVPFQCFHTPSDRLHHRPQPAEVCPASLVEAAKTHFPEVPAP
jgi:hypothetical protein